MEKLKKTCTTVVAPRQRVSVALAGLFLAIALAPSWAKPTKPIKRHSTSASKRTSSNQSIASLPRVVLGDHLSSVGLPPGWRHVSSELSPSPTGTGKATSDMFMYGDTNVGMLIMTWPMMANAHELDQMRNPQKYQLPGKPYRLGGIAGNIRRSTGTITIAAIRGGKYYGYQMAEAAAQLPGSAALVLSFRPR